MVHRQHRLSCGRTVAGWLRPRRARGRSRARHQGGCGMKLRAALYTVVVRPKAKRQPRPLGDIDGSGTTLIDALARLVDGFAATSADGRVVRALTARRDGDDL